MSRRRRGGRHGIYLPELLDAVAELRQCDYAKQDPVFVHFVEPGDYRRVGLRFYPGGGMVINRSCGTL
jgi:hypothetical protein